MQSIVGIALLGVGIVLMIFGMQVPALEARWVPSVRNTSPAWPICWIHLHEACLLFISEWKKPLGIGLESIRATGSRTTTHQHGWVGIMAESNGMAQLVGDHVARDIGQRKRITAITLDPYQVFCPSWRAGGKRNEIPQ